MLAHLAGLGVAGTALGALVAGLALLAAATGLCVGCELYKLGARLRGVRPGAVGALDLADVGAAPGRPAVVQFAHPLCSDCRELSERLAGGPSRSTPWTCPGGPTWPAATTWPSSRPPSGSPATAPWSSVSPSRPWSAGAGSRSRPRG